MTAQSALYGVFLFICFPGRRPLKGTSRRRWVSMCSVPSEQHTLGTERSDVQRKNAVCVRSPAPGIQTPAESQSEEAVLAVPGDEQN